MLRLIFAAALLAAGPSYGLAVDLDAPLNDKPTVRSEVKRGFEYSFHCMMEDVGNISVISKCVSDAVTQDEQRHPDHEPFELGLYLGECIWLKDLLETDTKLVDRGNGLAANDVPDVRRELYFSYKIFRVQQGKTGLSDQQIIDASGIAPTGKASTLSQMRDWEKSAPESGPLPTGD